ncbi:MAG: T9SS type A sorting domain-containing protein [Bacteroidia bacterium]
MKTVLKYLTVLLIIFIVSGKSFSQPLSFIIDSISFSSLDLEGGKTIITIADLNQDGNPDLFSIGDHGSPYVNSPQHGISLWFGNGTGTGWTLYQTGDFGYGGISAGDLNNDGLMDVAYGMHHNYSSTDFGDQLIEAALGDGTGFNWIPWDDSLATAGETYGMFGTDMGDVDNDGLLDIGSTSFGCCAGYHVYKNLGTGVWQHFYGYVGGNASNVFLFGDINHDGLLDFVTAHQNGTPYFGDGTGNFVLRHLNLPAPGLVGFSDVTLGDVNKDGADDIAFTQNNGVFVYRFDTTTQLWVNMSGILPASGFHPHVRLYDVNNDGFLDVIASQANTVKIWTGNGGTAWTLVNSITVSNMDYSRSMAVGDVNHDGKPEIFIWGQFPTGLFNYENKLMILRDTATVNVLNIYALNPVAYECLPNGSVQFIHWNSSVPANHSSSVSLEFSSTGAGGAWSVIAAGVPNNGTYQWSIPGAIQSANCFIRYILTDSVTQQTDTAITSNPFNIGCVLNTGISQLTGGSSSWQVYPNPANESLTLALSKGEGPNAARNSILRIFDLTGREVFQSSIFNFQSSIKIDVSGLQNGVYFIQLNSAEVCYRTKFVKQ